MSHYHQYKPKNNKHTLLPAFTLVELLVSVAIVVILLSALYSIYLTSFKSYQRNIVRAEMNQNARISLERMTRDIRQTNNIVTDLPPAPNDPLNPPSSEIMFVDGHDTDKIQYIKYSVENNNLMRKLIHYYFSSNPDSWLTYDTRDGDGNLPLESVDENVVKANQIQSLKFYGKPLINIHLVVQNENNMFIYESQTLGRNIQ